MLGKLFSLNGATSPRAMNPLDSSVEDHFTHQLLFPDAEALYHNDQVFALSSGTILTPAAAINAFDVTADMDLEMRDVRVIIMQEATPTAGAAYLLYDSHAPPPAPSLDLPPPSEGSVSAARERRQSVGSPRKASVGQTARPVLPQSEREPPRTAVGAFDRRPAPLSRGPTHHETEGQRSAREYREEVATFSSCIFGHSDILAYKGPGTKVHVLPSEPRSMLMTGSYAGDGSLGRSSLRSSRLAPSFTSENAAPGPTPAGFTTIMRGSERKKVLITRVFPVPLPNEETDDGPSRTPTPQTTQSNDVASYPFPHLGESPEKKLKPKQKRTPMYAVGLIVNLPAAPHAPSAPASRSSFRAGSYNEQESCPSSFSSTRRAGWTLLGHGFGVESLDSSYSSDLEDRIDTITPHWDIIMRTLSHLQVVATASVLPMLKQADLTSPDPRVHVHHRAPSASISISGKRVSEDYKSVKPAKSTTKMVQLMPNCLMQVPRIHKEVDFSRQRIVSGIKTRQVVTGQGRWGIWREEARLVAKWAGGKDEGFFFFNLLTGFLGTHTEWLRALSPSWYRRRHYQQQRAHKDDDISLPARTIIISDNKLMARRLIFLLSAFLPSLQQLSPGRQHRPSISASVGGSSQSPPVHAVPILREEPLRRRINKRSGTSRSGHSHTMSIPAQVHGGAWENQLDRRTSDAASIRTADLPIPGSTLGTRKSSAATTSIVTPVTSMPHFSRRSVRGTAPSLRPGSSGSLATDDLLRSLSRGDSTGHYSSTLTDSPEQGSRWGSMISGLWGSKRRGSTAATTPPESEIHDPHFIDTSREKNKLAEMVEEVTSTRLSYPTVQHEERELRESESGSASTARPNGAGAARDHVAEQVVQVNDRIPDPTGAYESPVKTSINDGIIDIDVPLPEYLSFESAVSSPSSSGFSFGAPGLGWGLGNGMEGFEHYSRTGPDTDTTLNVGGWLPRYHPDFALQAIPRQEDLMDELKASMRAEPTPALSSSPHHDPEESCGRWVEVCSAIVADATTFTIKHIRYRRLVKPINFDRSAPSPLAQSHDSKYGNVYAAAALTPNIDVYERPVEERFIEEPIISMDETLIEAVERITAQSRQCSKGSSVCSSRPSSRQGRKPERSKSIPARPESIKETNVGDGAGSIDEARLEVPRNECKKMILTALEEIVRSVVDSRERDARADEKGPPQMVDRERERESFLREGVRAWLGSVESAE